MNQILAIIVVVALIFIGLNTLPQADLVPTRYFNIEFTRSTFTDFVKYEGGTGPMTSYPSGYVVGFRNSNNIEIDEYYNSSCFVDISGSYSSSTCTSQATDTFEGEVIHSGDTLTCAINFPFNLEFNCGGSPFYSSPTGGQWSATSRIYLFHAPLIWLFDINMPYEAYEADGDQPRRVWQYVGEYDTWYIYTDNDVNDDNLVIQPSVFESLFGGTEPTCLYDFDINQEYTYNQVQLSIHQLQSNDEWGVYRRNSPETSNMCITEYDWQLVTGGSGTETNILQQIIQFLWGLWEQLVSFLSQL